MKAYLIISILAAALTWFVGTLDPDLVFGVVFVLCLIMPIIADTSGVMKKKDSGPEL